MSESSESESQSSKPKVGLDDFLIKAGADGLGQLIKSAETPKMTEVEKLLSILRPKVELFHDQHDSAWARVKVRDHFENWRVKGTRFSRFATKVFYDVVSKPPTPASLEAVIRQCESEALFDGDTYQLSNRVAEHSGSIYYDMADSEWSAVKIDPDVTCPHLCVHIQS